jgi:hypothetical protein
MKTSFPPIVLEARRTTPDCDVGCGSCSACEQPPEWEHTGADGVFIKQMLLAQAGMMVPQHAHEYDHTTMLATGSVRVWIDGQLAGDHTAPKPLFIQARIKHTFQSLEPATLLYCIHNVAGRAGVKIHAEHQLTTRSA